MSDDAVRARLRALPAVDRLAAPIMEEGWTEAEAVAAARAVLAERRAELLAGADDAPDLAARGRARLRPSLRRVLNGTGVIVHTNLGRAPLAEAAARAVAEAARGSANVELELADGTRGSRHDHVAGLLRELTGADDALAVNNGAGAALLAVAALAGGAGRRSSRAGSWSRSAAASACPRCSRRPARGWSRSAPPTAPASATTSARSRRSATPPASSSASTSRTSARSASSSRSRSSRCAGSACR